MNRLIAPLCTLAIAFSLTGCKHRQPAYTICLLDVSKSITPDGVNYEFKSANDLVDAMQRGDRLTLIPIASSAIADTPGHILRFSAPIRRQPYDYDLVVFRKEAHQQIEAMHYAASVHPSTRTDILGTLDLAGEEFAADATADDHPRQDRELVVSTDLIEDDGEYRFSLDPALASDADARALAERIWKATNLALSGVRIHLNAVESADLHRLTLQRQRAIRAFWSDYFSKSSQMQANKLLF